MTIVTLELPEKFAPVKGSLEQYLPTIVELRSLDLKTNASQLAREIIDLLWSSPTSAEVLGFKISAQSQSRLTELLEKNREGTLTAADSAEMDEIETINDIVSLLKVQLA